MVSVITDRVSTVVDGTPVSANGFGIVQCENVAGINTITATTNPPISQYLLNQFFSIRPVIANTGPVDVNLNAVGFVNLLKPSGAELAEGEFVPELEYLAKFNGVDIRIVAPSF